MFDEHVSTGHVRKQLQMFKIIGRGENPMQEQAQSMGDDGKRLVEVVVVVCVCVYAFCTDVCTCADGVSVVCLCACMRLCSSNSGWMLYPVSFPRASLIGST
jgi:hypothetical protein